ncbi:hypothetical protein BDZ89DRAFT_1055331 [Hymenopellis radicata]|nr:hypothetical protein BDZ89DRAFT_1055331 [Hymenopellis radicata]
MVQKPDFIARGCKPSVDEASASLSPLFEACKHKRRCARMNWDDTEGAVSAAGDALPLVSPWKFVQVNLPPAHEATYASRAGWFKFRSVPGLLFGAAAALRTAAPLLDAALLPASSCSIPTPALSRTTTMMLTSRMRTIWECRLRGRGHRIRGHQLRGHQLRGHQLRGHRLRGHRLRGHRLRGLYEDADYEDEGIAYEDADYEDTDYEDEDEGITYEDTDYEDEGIAYEDTNYEDEDKDIAYKDVDYEDGDDARRPTTRMSRMRMPTTYLYG